MNSCCENDPSPPRSVRLGDYVPLMVLVAVSLAVGTIRCVGSASASVSDFMRECMGMFLVLFATLKLFDVRGFARSFCEYDLVAARWRGYALLYPFLELAVGLVFLSGRVSQSVLLATIFVLAVSAVGVALAVSKKRELQCACMGSQLKVPLSHVALIENVLMMAMAIAMLMGNAS